MITLNVTVSFIIGLALGGVAVNFYWLKKIQKSKGNKSPNIMGDGNSVKM